MNNKILSIVRTTLTSITIATNALIPIVFIDATQNCIEVERIELSDLMSAHQTDIDYQMSIDTKTLQFDIYFINSINNKTEIIIKIQNNTMNTVKPLLISQENSGVSLDSYIKNSNTPSITNYHSIKRGQIMGFISFSKEFESYFYNSEDLYVHDDELISWEELTITYHIAFNLNIGEILFISFEFSNPIDDYNLPSLLNSEWFIKYLKRYPHILLNFYIE